jgi:hypothetical protein
MKSQRLAAGLLLSFVLVQTMFMYHAVLTFNYEHRKAEAEQQVRMQYLIQQIAVIQAQTESGGNSLKHLNSTQERPSVPCIPNSQAVDAGKQQNFEASYKFPSSPIAISAPLKSNTVPLQHLELPLGVKGVIINVGSNKDPPVPPKDNSSIHVIAVEPILNTARKIPNPDGRTHVVVTAIAGGPPRFHSMRIFNQEGVSSSLAAPSHDSFWNTGNNRGAVEHVTVMPMDMLLNSIPEHIDIVWLKTDMQGFDFEAIKSAGRDLLRVSKLSTEVHCEGLQSYAGVKNDLALDWMEYMDAIGFDLANSGSLDPKCLIKSGSRKPGAHEADAEWVLKRVT